MTRDVDDDTWLKNIGSVSAYDDDDDEPAMDGAGVPAAPDAFDTDEGDGAAAGDDDHDGQRDRAADHDGGLRREFLGGSPFDSVTAAVDLDTQDAHRKPQGAAPRRFTPWVLAAFGALAVVGTVITLVVTMANSPGSTPAAPAPAPVAPRTVKVAPPPSAPPNVDGPLTFMASSDCPPGSTAAQLVADPNAAAPWICVRSVDGQVVRLDLGTTFVITAVSIVPGAVTKADGNPNDPDPWLQHRVVTRLQWQFNDTDRTVKNQNTGNVRGEAVEPIRPGVAASKITVIIQETSRPPAIAPSTPDKAHPPGSAGRSILGDILGGDHDSADPAPTMPGDGASRRDPADGTFAVTSIKVIGHRAV